MATTNRLLPRVGTAEIRRMLPKAKLRSFSAGDVILKEGTRADSCYLVTTGRVQISKRMKTRTATDLAVVSKGDFIGEMAMLSGQTRSATATARTSVEAIEIRRADFVRLLRRSDPLASRLALQFSAAMALRCSRVLQLLAKNPGDKLLPAREAARVHGTLTRVYSLWTV